MVAPDDSKRVSDEPGDDELLDEEWLLDEDAGPVVRPYTLTGGRAVASGDFDLIALVSTVTISPETITGLHPEHLAVLGLCQEALSVAEISARLDLPLGVTRVLLTDLKERGQITVDEPGAEASSPDDALLAELLEGLRRL